MPASCECLSSVLRLNERAEYGVDGDRMLEVDADVEERLGDGLGANGLFDLTS